MQSQGHHAGSDLGVADSMYLNCLYLPNMFKTAVVAAVRMDDVTFFLLQAEVAVHQLAFQVNKLMVSWASTPMSSLLSLITYGSMLLTVRRRSVSKSYTGA